MENGSFSNNPCPRDDETHSLCKNRGSLSCRKRMFVWSPALLACVAAVCAGVSLWMVYHTLLQENESYLVREAKERLRLLDKLGQANAWDGDKTLKQFAHSILGDSEERGRSGECVIGEADGDSIRLLYRSSAHPSVTNDLVSDTALAEPMRNAIAGRSGTMIGKDYQGQTVLAAYAPVPRFGWGICSKVRLAEVNHSFFQTAAILASLTLALTTLGGLLIVQLGKPLIQELEAARNRLSRALEGTKHGVWDWPDVTQPAIKWSEQAEIALGYQPGSLKPTLSQFEALLHPEDVGPTFAAINSHLREHVPFDIEYRLRDNSAAYHWFRSRGQAAWDANGKPTSMSGSIEDVQPQKDAEQRYVQSIRRLERVNRLQEDLIVPAPLDEKFKKITDSAVSLLDLDFCRLWTIAAGDICSECIHAATDETHVCRRRDRCLHLVASSGRYTQIDGTHRRVPLGLYKIGRIATGEERKTVSNNVTSDPRIHNHEWAKSLGLVSFAGYKLRDARGNTVGVFAMFANHTISEEDDAFLSHLADITSKVIVDNHAQAEFRQSQKLEEIGQLAGGVAHEFNNLLQVIDGYACAGMEGLNPGEERFQNLGQVRRAAKRAAALTRQLLGFSRRTNIEPRSTDANQVVRDLIKLVRPTIGEHVTIDIVLDDAVGNVYADPGELEQALLNLCLNARDAMPEGGNLVIKTERVAVTEPLWDVHFNIKPGTYVVYTVSDTGAGIPREIQQRIFEPFFTTKEVGKGTGLGLALVYGIIRQHHGAVHLYSEAGSGTTFRLYLPPGNGETGDVDEPEPARDYAGHETILVAEDEPMVRQLTVTTLERAGYVVYSAADGEEAMQLFDTHRSDISLVLLDAVMPRRSGHEVHRHINEHSPNTRVICCTGYDRETARLGCLTQEKVPLLQKPFTAQALLQIVRQSLDAHSQPHIAENVKC